MGFLWSPGGWLHCAVSWSHGPQSNVGPANSRGNLKLKDKLSWRALVSVPNAQSGLVGRAG